jgi:hypothetical protein
MVRADVAGYRPATLENKTHLFATKPSDVHPARPAPKGVCCSTIPLSYPIIIPHYHIPLSYHYHTIIIPLSSHYHTIIISHYHTIIIPLSYHYHTIIIPLVRRAKVCFYQRAISAITFSANSHWLVAVGADDRHRIGLWDWGRGTLLSEAGARNGTFPQVCVYHTPYQQAH